MKKVVMYVSIFLLIAFFGYSFTFISKYQNYTYSYEMYYLQGKTNCWQGNNGLEVKYNTIFDYTNMESRHERSSYDGLQYLGKNFFEKRTFVLKIKEIYINEECSLFYQIKKENLNKKYSINIEVKDEKNNNITFTLNNLPCNYTKNGNTYSIRVDENAERNELVINSSEKVQLMNLSFMEIK